MNAVAVVSGGMDSVTMLYAHKDAVRHVLSFDYGSKHNAKELPCAAAHAARLEKPHTIITLPFIGQHFTSNLLKSGDSIPDGNYSPAVMKQTVVPFRNGIMLSIAAGFAESHKCDTVLLGNHFNDHAIYPDCRPVFVTPMAEAIREGTYARIELHTPFLSVTKRDIAVLGRSLNVEYPLTWSCYKGEDVHCGTCSTCIERRQALAGFDTTVYATDTGRC